MRRIIITISIISIVLLLSNACAPASKSWVTEYTNSRVNLVYSQLNTRLSNISDSLRLFKDSLNVLNQKIQELSDSISAIPTLSSKIDQLSIKLDTLETAVDSVKHFQRQIVPAYLKTLRDIIDEYIQSTQDTL